MNKNVNSPMFITDVDSKGMRLKKCLKSFYNRMLFQEVCLKLHNEKVALLAKNLVAKYKKI